MSRERSPARQQRKTGKARKKKKPLSLAEIKCKFRYSVEEFCLLYDVSRSGFYEMLDAGEGPDITKEGRLTKITAEAAERWSRWRESETARVHAEKKTQGMIATETQTNA